MNKSALIDYIAERSKENLMGGIIEKSNNWHYSPFHIETTEDIAGWNVFFPDEYK